MLFEAKLKDTKYQVSVDHKYPFWEISVQKENCEPNVYQIPEKDFKEVDSVVSFLFKGKSYLLDVLNEGTEYNVYTRGSYRTVEIFNDEMLLHESLKSGGSMGGGSGLSAGMPGKIVKVMVKEGQEVKEGDSLLVMEAMKMENEMRSSQDGIIAEVKVAEADTIEGGATLITFEKEKK